MNLQLVRSYRYFFNIEVVCIRKDITSSYHMRISLTGNMHVGLIIIKVGESIKGLIGEQLGEN